MRGVATSAILVAMIAAGAILSSEASAQASDAIYSDTATGISFRAPAGLHVTPARIGVGGRTTQAIFATYPGADDPTVRVAAPLQQLVVTAYLATRAPNEDLRAWAAENARNARYTVSDLPGRDGILLDGDFQAGPRKYLLIAKSPTQVLVVDAFPARSARIGIFNALLASLEVR